MPIKPLFQPGHLLPTPGVLELVNQGCLKPMDFLFRHISGDWGDISEAMRRDNDTALKRGQHVLSLYNVTLTVELVICTAADRSMTILSLAGSC